MDLESIILSEVNQWKTSTIMISLICQRKEGRGDREKEKDREIETETERGRERESSKRNKPKTKTKTKTKQNTRLLTTLTYSPLVVTREEVGRG